MRRRRTTWDENVGLNKHRCVSYFFSIEVEPIFVAVIPLCLGKGDPAGPKANRAPCRLHLLECSSSPALWAKTAIQPLPYFSAST
jgi:hypothetical protein